MRTFQRVQHSLAQVSTETLTQEQQQLIQVIERVLSPAPTAPTLAPHDTPDSRAEALFALRQHTQLTQAEVYEVLMACTDTRRVSAEKREALELGRYGPDSVGSVAWELLEREWTMPDEAVDVLIHMVGHADARVCAASVLWLQTNNKRLPPAKRQLAAQNIVAILSDDMLSRRPLDPPDRDPMRLDDMLFEALQVLAE